MRPRQVVILAALLGCAGEDEIGNDESYAVAVTPLLLCMQGLTDRSGGDDKGLFDFCNEAEDYGLEVVRDGVLPAFGAMSDQGAYAALFDALDSNDDGKVDGGDQPRSIHLAGFSWGGMNIASIAFRLAADPRIQGNRDRVEALVLFDPFQPLRFSTPIAPNVARAWVYRQSEPSPDDCSAGLTFGAGYHAPPPEVKNANTKCNDYDLDAFLETNVSHCSMVTTSHQAGLVNLVLKKSYAPWHKHVMGCVID